MSAFRDGSRIEQEGLRRLRPWLAEHAEGGIFLETGGKGALSRLVQESIGDVIMRRDGGLLGIELKVEEEYAQSGRKNLWLEV